MGKSAPGYALCGFPHAILNRLLTLQGKNGGAHNSHCATLHTSRHHDGRLKSLGKIQRASLGTFKRAPTDLPQKCPERWRRCHQEELQHSENGNQQSFIRGGNDEASCLTKIGYIEATWLDIKKMAYNFTL